MTRLWIVRHGNTFAADEAPRRIGARTDLPLTDAGRAQAEALGRRFAAEGVTFDRILTGPLARTRDTAALIRAHRPGAPPSETCDWLAEIDHGPDEDRPEPEVTARLGQAALDAWDRHGTPPPGWSVDAPARIAAWRALFASARGTILLATSNGAARFARFADPALASAPSPLKLRTGAWGRIDIEDGLPRLIDWNRRP